MRLKKNLSVGLYIFVFIVVYFTFLILTHSMPLEYGLPIFQLIGLGLIIIGFFYFFLRMVHSKENKIILNINILTENTIVLMLMISMVITFFIPSVSFSDMIIDWSQISILNYLRGIIFLIGVTFVPGSCIYNMIFPENFIFQRFDVEPFFLKLTLYPVISFSFLGAMTLIFDGIGVERELFPLVLFLSVVGLFFGAISVSKHRKKGIELFKSINVTISKHTAFIIFLAGCVILIAFGLHTHTLYLQENDGYRIIRDAAFIATEDANAYTSYGVYWAYISFGLNALTGIPIINVNAMLFPYLSLFVFALYLFIKSFLSSRQSIYAILATMFGITFSSLFYFFQYLHPHERISLFIFDGLFNFRYKSFSLILYFVSSSFFLKSLNYSHITEQVNFRIKENVRMVLLSSFLLFQSFIIYYLPVISFILLFCCFFIFTKQKLKVLKLFIIFLVSFYVYLIIFDLLSQFFFSSVLFSVLNYFKDIFALILIFAINQPPIIRPIIVYITFTVLILFMVTVYWIYKKLFPKIRKISYPFVLNKKISYFLIMSIISLLIILEIMLNIIRTLRSLHIFTLFLDLVFFNIGIIGILALLSFSQTYKLNKNMFYTLFFWFLTIFLLALLGFFINTIKYPNLTPLQWPGDAYFRYISYWFQRIWYYSIVPLSIFASIGIITFIYKNDGIKLFKWRLQLKDRHFILVFCSLLVFFSLSNTILSGIAFQNQRSNNLNNEEAQITGWVSKNIQPGSYIFVDRRQLDKYLGLISATYTGLMSNSDVIKRANYQNYDYWVHKRINESCKIRYHDNIDSIEKIIEFNDNNTSDQIIVDISPKTGMEYGSIGFFLKTTNSSKGWGFNASRYGNLNAYSLFINSSKLFGLNGSTYHQIIDIESDEWYNLILDFECTNSNYLGLEQYEWKVTVNNTDFGPYNYGKNVEYLDRLKFYTSTPDANWSVFISQFSLLRDPEFRLEFFLFNYVSLFDYLTSLNFQYLILSSNPTEHRLKLEEYIDIENDLIAKLYKNKLYEYKTLTIYGI